MGFGCSDARALTQLSQQGVNIATHRHLMSSRCRVCAVIVTYHPDPALLLRLLDAIVPQVTWVVVVDNGSALDLPRLLADRSVTLLPLGENLGVAAGFNRGIAWAETHGAEQVLLLDQDSVPAPDMVGQLQAALAGLLDRGEAVATVGARARDPQTGHEVGFARIGKLCFRYVTAGPGETTVRTDFLISSGSLIPMATLRQVGVMDEELFIDLVDTEWCLRAAAAGLRSYGVPAALLHHGIGDRTAQLRIAGKKAGSLHHHGPLRHYYIFRNSMLLSRRTYVPWRWVLNNAVQLLGMFIYFSLLTPPRGQHLRMMLRGLWDGLKIGGGWHPRRI